ncbi:MAG TPA: hypothetical protein PK747_10805 [Acidobacteriota bacterium]|nr:hypothetical protein [Acidobacteriota bacterium]HQO20666.1 hypothetical protein [Acidobacteriota bacterium]HQQ47879.1 hypothetical protein [Acidobacteriota bacterium]
MSNKDIIRERLGEALSDLNISITSLKDELSRIQALVPAPPDLDQVAAAVSDAIPEPEPVKAEAPPAQGQAFNNKLLYHVGKLEYSSNQSEILKELMEYIREYAERALLYIVKDDNGKVWNHFGFDGQSPQTWTASLSGDPLLKSLMANRSRLILDGSLPGFIPAKGGVKRCMVSPLLLKGKVAAFVYADSGADGKLDHYSIDILIRTASLVLDLMPLRQKRDPQPPTLEEAGIIGFGQAASSPIEQEPEEVFEEAEEIPVEAVEEESPLERTAASRPRDTARLDEPEPASAPVEPAEVVEEAPPPPPPPPKAAPEEEPVPPEEQKEHEGAKRFARLLIQEIALYHPDEIEAGRTNKNLYSVLRDDIERSREAFEQRYQKPSIRKRDYFRKALVQYLADGDPTALGN